jgi:pyruvate dehydrogenase E2 component (dihydrolipoamide acetyltransferase)
MAVEVKLPRLGQGMEAGTIVRWLKSEGDPVSKGEPLYELDTDKVTQEVEAESDGVLLKIVVAEGEVDVGRTVAVIGAPDEDVSAVLDASVSGNGDVPSAAAEAPPTEPEQPAAEPPATATPRVEAPGSRAPGERVKASPLARRIARERGLALDAIAGTGPDGRVIAEDVEKASAGAPSAAAVPEAAPSPRRVPADEVEVVELTSVRRTIARRLTDAWRGSSS